jgi:transcriptional regulator with XRE-family HTH domain
MITDYSQLQNLSERITARMQDLGINQVELAEKAGLPISTVNAFCTGFRGREMSVPVMFKLKRALKVPVDFFDLKNSHIRSQKSVVNPGSLDVNAKV